MATLDDVLAPAPELISREAGGESVVILPEKARFIVLNTTGAEVLALLDGERSLGEVAAVLSERYDVPLVRTQDDVLRLADKLLDRGAARRSGAQEQEPR